MKRFNWSLLFLLGTSLIGWAGCGGSGSDGDPDGGVCEMGCPDDGDACTIANRIDTVTCDCEQVPITAFTAGDGCCPSGATNATDSDCAVECGNGVVETGEDCDDGNTVDDQTCPADCMVDAADCGNGTLDSGEDCDDGANVDGDGCSATCKFEGVEYSQDFETLDQTSTSALSDDLWLVFGNVFAADGTTNVGFYGAFPAPNFSADGVSPAFSAIDSGQGGADQGMQQLVVINDYNNPSHTGGAGEIVEAIFYRQRDIVAGDVGNTVSFTFNAKRGNINDPSGSSTATAFIKTLDPDNDFDTTNFIRVDMTAIPDTWAGYEVTIPIDAGLSGQVIQFGFQSRASASEPSGIFYDNLLVRSATTP